MSAAGLAELGLAPPNAAATPAATLADVDMEDVEALKAEEAQPKDLYTQVRTTSGTRSLMPQGAGDNRSTLLMHQSLSVLSWFS
jgi:hypothetical protein